MFRTMFKKVSAVKSGWKTYVQDSSCSMRVTTIQSRVQMSSWLLTHNMSHVLCLGQR